MRRALRQAVELHADAAGQSTLEWVLLLVVFGIPMIYVFQWLLDTLAEHYRFVQFLETLPFP